MKGISFTGYIPVRFFARHPNTGKFVPVLKEENVRKCQSFVIRNLNGTAKNIKNDEFVSFYKSIDKDYSRVKAARSIYDTDKPIVHMVTGSDVDHIDNMAKEMRIRKFDAYEATGETNSSEAKLANKDFYNRTRKYLKHVCRRIKKPDGQDATLQVFFEPKYTKKEHKLKGFEYYDARIVKSNEFENPS